MVLSRAGPVTALHSAWGETDVCTDPVSYVMESSARCQHCLKAARAGHNLPPESTEPPGTRVWAHTTRQEVLESSPRALAWFPASCLHPEAAPTWSKSS